MEVSVEELLQTNSVQELRAIATNLQREAAEKRQELQLMVGSRYHEFIESADTIGAMWADASALAQQLADFTDKCERLVQQGSRLLQQTTAGEYAGDQDDFFPRGVDEQAVWDCLDECDVHGAAVLIAVAAYQHSAPGVQRDIPVVRYLHKSARPTSDRGAAATSRAEDNSSVLFLSETVADDAQLLLLDSDLTLEQRCKILVALRYLQGLDDLQCMRTFLEAQDVLITEACERLGAGDLNREQLAIRLNEAVGLLQRCLLDAYLTFVSPCPPSVKESGLQQQLASSTETFTLFDAFKVEFGLRVEKRCRAAGSEGVVINRETAWKGTASAQTLKEAFFDWIMVHITRVADLTKEALSKLQSAAEVSRLQRLVWQQATRFMQDSDAAQQGHPCYNAQTWAEASHVLLRSPSRRSKVRAVPSREDDSLLLWSLLFRSSFLQQVENILSSASMSALARFRQCVDELFAPEGIVIDWENDVRVHIDARTHFAATTTSGRKGVRRARAEQRSASASRLQRQAEVLYALLQSETSNVLGDSWLPIEQGDPQSSESFATALYFSYCQLLASLMCTVRVLSISIQVALLEEQPVAATGDHRWVLLDALVTLGRFAWLLKSRSQFLEAALESSGRTGSRGTSVDKIAIDQLRSAFEIADTDGDGVLVGAEIHEAIHAVTDNVAEIKYSHVPSLTFVEFCLFCARLLDDVRPYEWLTECLDRLLSFTHETWAEHVIAAAAAGLTTGLHELFFLPSSAGELATVSCREHLDMWQQVTVSFEDEAGSEQAEHVFLPLKPSPPMSSFLFELQSRLQTSMLCAETFQRIPAGFPFAGENRDFVGLVVRSVRHRATALLIEVYGKLSQQAQQVVKKADIPVFRSAREDVFIQMSMDLEYWKSLHSQSAPLTEATKELSQALQDVLDAVASNLDPVNTELYLPYLRRLARAAADESRLLTTFSPAADPNATFANQANVQPEPLDVFVKNSSSESASRFLLLPVPTRTQYTTPTTPYHVEQPTQAATPPRPGGAAVNNNILPSKAFSLVGEVGASFISSASSMLRSSSTSTVRK